MQALVLLISSALIIPFIALNMLGGIVGGVWLAILGEWKILLIGLGGIFGGAIINSLLLAPGMLIAIPFVPLVERGGFVRKIVASPFLMVSMSWTVVIMCAWAAVSFALLGTSDTYGVVSIPNLLWAYTVATAPWSFLAAKDRQGGNHESAGSVFFLQVASILFALGLWMEWNPPAIGFWLVMALCLLTNVVRGGLALIRS